MFVLRSRTDSCQEKNKLTGFQRVPKTFDILSKLLLRHFDRYFNRQETRCFKTAVARSLESKDK